MSTQLHTILVVCRGNIARSPFAEAVIGQELKLRDLQRELRVLSRGVQGTTVDPEPVQFPNITFYPTMYSEVRPILDELGIDLSSHKATAICAHDMKLASVVFAMDQSVRSKLLTLFPKSSAKIMLMSEISNAEFDVTDPEVAAGISSQQQIFLSLRQLIIGNFPQLLAMANVQY